MQSKSLHGLRALGFTRRSTDEQSDTSNEQQEALLREFAERNGMRWVDVKHAKGVSGANTEHRDDLDDLFRRAENDRDFDVLLIQSYDRLTRGGARHGGYLMHRFDQLGVRVISVSHDIPDGDWSAVIEAVEFSKGRAYSKSLAFNTTRGALASILDGRATYCRKPPFGVDRLILDSNGNKLFRIRNLPTGEQLKLHWERDEEIERYQRNEKDGPFMHFVKRKEERIVLVNGAPDAVKVVRTIFKMRYIDKLGVHTITKWLNDSRIPTPQGKAKWNQCTVYAMLTNSAYTGRGIANRAACGEFNYRSSRREDAPRSARRHRRSAEAVRDPEDWIVLSLPHLDFVPEEVRDDIWLRQRSALFRRAEYGARVRALEEAKRDGTAEMEDEAVREIERMYCRANTHWPLVGSIFERGTDQPMAGYRCGPNMSYRYYFPAHLRTNPNSEYKGKCKFFRADPVEHAVLQVLNEVIGDVEHYRQFIEKHVLDRLGAATKDSTGLEQLRKKREKLRRKKAFALDQFDDLGEDLLAAKVGPLTSEIRALDDRIAAAERQLGARPEDAEKLINGIIDTLREIPTTLGEPSSATLRSVLSVLTRTSVDLQAREAEIEVRVPEAAFERVNALRGLCAAYDSVRITKQESQTSDALILAKYRCLRKTVKRHPCLECHRVAA